MAETLDIELPSDAWTDVSGTLTADTTYSLQNTSSAAMRMFESATVPTGDAIGFLFNPTKFTQIKPTAGFVIYCKPARGVGKVSISLSV
jgi:hypothetical protein